MPSELERAAADWQAAIAAGDLRARRELLGHWQATARRIDVLIRRHEARIRAAQARGESPGVTALYERGRLQQLRGEVERQVAAFGGRAAVLVDARRAGAAREAIGFAERLVSTIVPSAVLAPIREDVVLAAIANQAPGGPLATLMGEMGPDAGKRVAEGLSQGIALGQSPLVTARAIRSDVLPTYPRRAQVIARTETMRAIRSATAARYAASDVITGWVWWSSLDRTTCPACWAMHGTRHRADAAMDGHPSCRCVMIPDGPDIGEPVTPGEDVLRALPEEDQRAILGPSRYALMRSGDARLVDMVEQRQSQRWGTSRQVANLERTRRASSLRRASAPGPDRPPPAPVGADGPRAGAGSWLRGELRTDGNSLRARMERPMAADLERAIAVLDRVIALPLSAPVRVVGSDSQRWNGLYDPRESPAVIRLRRSQSSEDRLGTILHEVGHHLDGLASPQGYASRNQTGEGRPLFAWVRAVSQSATYQRIAEDSDIPRQDRKYLLSSVELWARSFEQWAVLRGGTAAEYGRITAMRTQWPADDFGPIAEAIDDVMEARGWRSPQTPR